MPLFERVALFGVGLIGGSLSLDARRENLFGYVKASSRRRESLEAALKRGIADDITTDPVECARDADLVVLAVPVMAMEDLAAKIAPSLGEKTIVTDVGSVKGDMVEKIEKTIPYSSMFVPAHPVAGSERYGPDAAVEGLFKDKWNIVTPTEKTDRESVDKIRALWEGVGMKVSEMDPHRHDKVLAAISHLPHVVAYALVDAVMRINNEDPETVNLAAGGFHDYTRIAASSPEMWRDIFIMNSSSLRETIDMFKTALDELTEMIKNSRGGELEERLDEIRRFKK